MDDELTRAEYVAETVSVLPARPTGEGYSGSAPDWYGPTLFGGFVLGQATSAISQSVPDGFEINSLHGYFLSAMRAGVEADYEVEVLRDGRSFAHRRLVGRQEGTAFFTMLASFAAPGRRSDFEYGRPLDSAIPRPDALEVRSEGDPFDHAWLGPTEPEDDGFLSSSMRSWMRFGGELAPDSGLHGALIAFMSDMTGHGARPLLLDETLGIAGIVSLDHAVHFHRPARADRWLFYDVTSTINTGGRGYLRGQIYDESGTPVASVAQETLLWDPRQ